MADIERTDNRITVRLPDKLLSQLTEEAERRGLDYRKRGIILIEALSDRYNKSQEDPRHLMNQIRETLRHHPELLDEPLRKIAAGELTKK